MVGGKAQAGPRPSSLWQYEPMCVSEHSVRHNSNHGLTSQTQKAQSNQINVTWA